jgi:hypothetical protein
MGKQPHDQLNSSEIFEAARGCGAGAAVVCSVLRTGAQLRLSARVLEVVRGKELFSQTVEGSRAEELFGMVDKLAEDLAHRWGDVVPRSRISPRGPEAMRSYQTGYDSFLTRDLPSAINNLDKATKIDPNFLLAQFRLGQACRDA